MKENNAKVIFIGTSRFAAPILEKLVKSNYAVPAVITRPDKPDPSPVKQTARKYGLKLWQPEKISEITKACSALKPDLIVVAAYGQLLPKEILDLPRLKALNLHPSLLPKYRGPSPVQSAILNNDKITGVTLMVIDEKMDHGPIISQKKIAVSPADTGQTLEAKLARESAALLAKTLPLYLKKQIKPRPQNDREATYTKLLSRQDGRIDLKKNARKAERKIRAFFPWPGAWTVLAGKRLKILKARLAKGRLVLEIVQPAGKKPMAWNEFQRGHKINL